MDLFGQAVGELGEGTDMLGRLVIGEAFPDEAAGFGRLRPPPLAEGVVGHAGGLRVIPHTPLRRRDFRPTPRRLGPQRQGARRRRPALPRCPSAHGGWNRGDVRHLRLASDDLRPGVAENVGRLPGVEPDNDGDVPENRPEPTGRAQGNWPREGPPGRLAPAPRANSQRPRDWLVCSRAWQVRTSSRQPTAALSGVRPYPCLDPNSSSTVRTKMM